MSATSMMNAGNGQTITVCGNIFRLVETIGRGSYGTVHKAINLSSGAAVAVKLIGKDKLKRAHERQSIEKEIETMRVAVEQFENGHPHIVRLLCTKESQHHIFIVLEYCAGGDLAALMKANRGLTEEQAKSYMSQLASGLQFLRSQNVVHRDLKPANLLLSSKNLDTAKLKIADFGFARRLQSEALAESVVGSPLYMAPELLEYKSYDAKADLWSVGIILYEMLVDDHPFLVVDNCHAMNHLALRRNILRYFEKYGRVHLPSHIKVSTECEELLNGLLRIDPRQRISFDDFFRASFLQPPLPSEDAVAPDLAASTNKQALVAEKHPDNEDWASFSDEYVIVDREYQDIGRRVLNENDLKTGAEEKRAERKSSAAPLPVAIAPTANADESNANEDAAAISGTAAPATPAEQTQPQDTTQSHQDSLVKDAKHSSHDDTPLAEQEISRDPRAQDVEAYSNGITEDKRDYAVEEHHVEELMGISYKSFECGSIVLCVPTPFGDYIAFHEGCPHYYLSQESIEAFKRDGRDPSYVLGYIVFIEDFVASEDGGPFCLREGTPYHIVTVSPLSLPSSIDYDGMPLSPALSPAPLSDPEPLSPPAQTTGGFFSSLSSYLKPLTPSVPAPTSTRKSPVTFAVAGPKSSIPHQRISFRNFQISDLVLFFLKGGKLPYVAFNESAPNYFLATESIDAVRGGTEDAKANPAYVLGEIIFIDTFQATEDFNPYRLPYGTRFYVVTVANPTRS